MTLGRATFVSIALVVLGLGIAFTGLLGALSEKGVSGADLRWSYAEVRFTFDQLGTPEKERLEAALQTAEEVRGWRFDVSGLDVEVAFDFKKLSPDKLESILRGGGLSIARRGTVQYVHSEKGIEIRAWLDAPAYRPGSSAALYVEATPASGFTIGPGLNLYGGVKWGDGGGQGFSRGNPGTSASTVRLVAQFEVPANVRVKWTRVKVSVAYSIAQKRAVGPRRGLDRWVPLRVER